MARTVRDAALATRSARLRLSARTKPYWRMLEQGLHLGYRRCATAGSWIARRRDENGIYHEEKLGRADDLQDADDAAILDFSQAQRAARTWWTNQQRLAAGLPAGTDGPYTVKRAIADYLHDFRRRGARGAEVIESVVGCNVLPALSRAQAHHAAARRLAPQHRRAPALLAFPRRRAAQYGRVRPEGSLSGAAPARQRQPGAHLSQGRAQPRLAQRRGAVGRRDIEAFLRDLAQEPKGPKKTSTYPA